MSKAQLVITAVVLEGRGKSDVARDYDVSRQWCISWSNATKPTGPRHLHRAHAGRTPIHGPSAQKSKTVSFGCAKP
jgi:transposase